MTCFCIDPQPETCAVCSEDTRVSSYRARDARISIGLPVKQDNGEWEFPGFIDDVLIGFYATRHHADLALHNILDVTPSPMPALDLDFVSVGWA